MSVGPAERVQAGDLREVSWWVLVGAAAGAISGLVIGGIGGRLAMLLLRVTSPDTVIGLTSDDGFEIGAVTTDTIPLLAAMAALGGVNGVLYVALRSAIPVRLRLPLWSLMSAVGVGANVIHSDGVDFTVLEPSWLAITLFLALPLAAGAFVVVLVERWVDREPFADRRLSIALGVAALLGSIALIVALAVGCAASLIRRLGLARVIGRVARVLVPILLAVAIVYYAAAALDTASIIL